MHVGDERRRVPGQQPPRLAATRRHPVQLPAPLCAEVDRAVLAPRALIECEPLRAAHYDRHAAADTRFADGSVTQVRDPPAVGREEGLTERIVAGLRAGNRSRLDLVYASREEPESVPAPLVVDDRPAIRRDRRYSEHLALQPRGQIDYESNGLALDRRVGRRAVRAPPQRYATCQHTSREERHRNS